MASEKNYITRYELRDHLGNAVVAGGQVKLTDERAAPLLAQGLISPLPLAGDGEVVTTNTGQAALALAVEKAKAALAKADAAVEKLQADLAKANPKQKGLLTTVLNKAVEKQTKAQADLDVALAALEPAE